MAHAQLRVVYITAGAGGMICGSCLQDNTLARALAELGVDIQLVPLYTPIRTDEPDESIDRVFFGGISVQLEQAVPLLGRIPLWDRLLDRPGLLRWATAGAGEADPARLGPLTVSMLRGTQGRQRREVLKLCRWLAQQARPQLVQLTNMLVAGCVPAIKSRLGVPVLVTLQGDDVFVDRLVEPYRSRALDEIRQLVSQVDGFVVHSRYYADYMADYFDIPPSKLHVVPLGIDLRDYPAPAAIAARPAGSPLRIGYLARLMPEKGLHVLVDAFIRLRQRREIGHPQLHVAGWLGRRGRRYAEEQFDKLRRAGLGDAFGYAGELDRAAKLRFLASLDLFSVPSVYPDPKGLYVLEALAAGVPVVQPAHGAFPEMLERLQGGRLFPPGDPAALAQVLAQLLADRRARLELAEQGCRRVHQLHSASRAAQSVLAIYRQLVPA